MQLRAEEAAVVEKAVRLAVESVMNVLSAVNSARTHELQRLVADRERQIRRLEGRVRETEAELRLLLRPRSPGAAPGRIPEPQGVVEPDSGAEQRDCDVLVSLALLTGPSSQDFPDAASLDRNSSSGDQSASAAVSVVAHCPTETHVPPRELPCPVEEGSGRESSRPTMERPVKQERLYPSPGRVKPEPLSPDYGQLHQDDVDSPALFLKRTVSEEVSPRVQGALGHAEQWQGASSQVEDPAPAPHTSSMLHTVSWRGRTSTSRREQSEEAMRRRRASWRAASRRYYARKMARLQTHTSGLQFHSHNTSLQTQSQLPQSSCPGPLPQYASCSGAPASHTDAWRYSVCELTPLHHQPPSNSSEVTFITATELLNGSLT